MKKLVSISAIIVMSLIAVSARAQPASQHGMWEVSQTNSVSGQTLPPLSKRICLKGPDATLERLLLLPSSEDFTALGCVHTESVVKAGTFKTIIVCPATDRQPGITASAEITFSATSYKGQGPLEILLAPLASYRLCKVH